jgi:hypothetical protein
MSDMALNQRGLNSQLWDFELFKPESGPLPLFFGFGGRRKVLQNSSPRLRRQFLDPLAAEQLPGSRRETDDYLSI